MNIKKIKKIQKFNFKLSELYHQKQDLFFALFVDERPVLRKIVPKELLSLMEDLEILKGDDYIRSTIRILKIKDYFFATDHVSYVGDENNEGMVLPLHPENLYLEEEMKISGREKVLEIGVGSGINSILALMKGAEKIVALDVNPRTFKYTKFNLALNNVSEEKIDMILNESDLIEDILKPVKDEKFNYIIVNPPFEYGRDEKTKLRNSSGGKDGLDIVRSIISNIDNYLYSEGKLQMVFFSPGIKEGPTELIKIARKLKSGKVEVKYRSNYMRTEDFVANNVGTDLKIPIEHEFYWTGMLHYEKNKTGFSLKEDKKVKNWHLPLYSKVPMMSKHKDIDLVYEEKENYILGLNSAYHESSACLIKNGKIIAMAEEERFNRRKHAKSSRVDNPDDLPINAINYCLKIADIELSEVSSIGYSLNPSLRLKKNLEYNHNYDVAPGDFGTKEGEKLFFEKNLNVEKKVRNLGFKGDFYYLNHHDCHAASSFFVSNFNKAAVMVVDGIGEFESTTLYLGDNNKLELFQSINYPNSLGFLWEKFSKFLGFSEYDAAKVMGLTSYGDSKKYFENFKKLIQIYPDGTFTINDEIVKFRSEDYSSLEELFKLKKRSGCIRNVDKNTINYVHLAATLQKVTEDILIKLARNIKKQTNAEYLCLSGGVALNCVANGKLLQKNLFKDVFIQPAANDAGTAIGAAFYIWNQLLDKNRSFIQNDAYLSSSFSEDNIEKELFNSKLIYKKSENISKEVASLLNSGKVVAWFQGGMEIGPRALGNRSILCDPRKKEVVALLNYKVKHREPFRPFCPSVLVDNVSEWFEVKTNYSPIKFMLAAVNVLNYKRSMIPAVTHVDGTARIQIVEKETNSNYYELIKEFEKLTGVPILLNTSFNDQEPIVCTPKDAINTFLKTKIDFLAIGNFLISRRENEL